MSQRLDDSVEVPYAEDGPYRTRLGGVVAHVPARIRSVASESGGMARLLCAVVASAVRHPRGYWTAVVEEMANAIRKSALSISVALFGFLLALSIPAQKFVFLAGAGELYGPLLLVQSTRTFTVWVATLLVAGVMGAAMTAELGSRKVREELDALQVMGVDPLRELAVPRIVAITLITTLLAIPAEIITIGSSLFSASYVAGIPLADALDFLFQSMSPAEVVFLLVNCALAGLLVGVVCCYKGLTASGGAIGLGRAVNQAVIISFVSLFTMQLGYNALVLGFFPGLGEFR